MNADLGSHAWELEPIRLDLPEAAWARLRARLEGPLAEHEAWQASLGYGVSVVELWRLVEHWRDELELPDRLLDLPCFEADVAGLRLRFVFSPSAQKAALPLLLLHGYAGSLFELGALAPALSDAGCDVVSLALPGSGSSCAPLPAFVKSCAALMQRLGYSRYAVHGSDLGASLALQLAASDSAHVAALHVTHVPAYPGPEPSDFATLTPLEKSRLARLTELHEQLQFQLPQTPVEELAFALSRFEGAEVGDPERRDALLTSLTLGAALGDFAHRAALYRASYLSPAPPSNVPLSLWAPPLAPPSLRRFVERGHRVVDWQELESGGPSPGIEQPERLLQALASFCERLR